MAAIMTTPHTAGAQTADDDSQPQLVRRNQVQLTLAGAERAIVASRSKAEQMGVNVNISVVDDGGHLLAFVRMDGARPGSVYTSMTKATSAATKRGATGPLPNADSANTHLSLAVEAAAAVSGGKFTTLKGGVPIVINDQVIGAVGVGGATGEQDAEVATAGVAALTQEIESMGDALSADDGNHTKDSIVGNWLAESIEQAGVIDRVQTTLQIAADGSVSGDTGVNRFHGKAEINGNELQIGPTAMTRRAGPPAMMDQESRFVAALGKVKQFRIDDNGMLFLLDANNAELLRMSPLPSSN
ncbi:heme-binding protein [Stieleria sp. TO1_6]|uniref:heme-binding protein n=1 Tax=Stieleria tagensis TaxID=2956795 RepID=UPI00209BA3E7|nr:heme-binding protein [Stieleria tagensis]MCO8121402.1 heme-binding protein [Stieleria tagensis]